MTGGGSFVTFGKENLPETNHIPSKQHEKGGHRAQAHQDFDGLAVAIGKGVGQRQEFVFVNKVRQEDSVQNKRQSL